MNTLGERLDWFRKQKKMSLEELGIFLGYGQAKTAARQVMSRILNDHRKLTLENLEKLQNITTIRKFRAPTHNDGFLFLCFIIS